MILATRLKIWNESMGVMLEASKVRMGWVVRRWGEAIVCDMGFFLAIEVVNELRSVAMYCEWYELILIAIVACGILKGKREGESLK